MIQPAIKRVIGFVDPSSTVPVSDAAAALEERLIADISIDPGQADGSSATPGH